MLRAHGFWIYPERWAKALGTPLNKDSRILDVGCGWGRITRMFARDTAPHNIYGCDIDQEAITLCRYLGVPGQFILTEPGKPLPFPDNHFSLVTASSVFTHIPENVSFSLLTEFSRVLKPGGLIVFTVEDYNFFNNFEIPGIETYGERWRLLSRYKKDLPRLRNRFKAGEYIYLVTNNEAVRSSDVYGDAIIPKEWFERNCSSLFQLRAYAESAPPVYQAIVVGTK